MQESHMYLKYRSLKRLSSAWRKALRHIREEQSKGKHVAIGNPLPVSGQGIFLSLKETEAELNTYI